MSLLSAFIRVVLSVVFAVAGLSKLMDRPGTRSALTKFGSPETLTPALAVLLPATEMGIAVALVFNRTAFLGTLAAILLLMVFVVAIAINLVRGRTPECHCFGQIYSRPIGWPTLVRNALFALAGVLVLWIDSNEAPLNSVSVFQSPLAITCLVTLALIACTTIFLDRRRSRSGAAASAEILSKGLPVNSAAPPFELDDYEGGKKSLRHLLESGKPILLIFTSPFCGPCVTLFAEVGKWQQAHSDEITVVIVSRGTIKENFVNTVRNGLQNVLLQRESEVADLYKAKVTPTAVIIRRDGKIGSAIAAGADEIRTLLQQAVGRGGDNLELQWQEVISTVPR